MKTVYSAVPLALLALAARADIINNNYNDNNHFNNDVGNPVGNAFGNTNANGNNVGNSVNANFAPSSTPVTAPTMIPIEFMPVPTPVWGHGPHGPHGPHDPHGLHDPHGPHGPHGPHEEPEPFCNTPVASPSTLTRTETQTFCPKCAGHKPTPPVWHHHAPEQTVYTTVFKDLCPTGVTSVTYTITEDCPCTATRPAHHMPPGFTSTVKSCHTCGPTPITETCTVPIETAHVAPTTSVAVPIGTGYHPVPHKPSTSALLPFTGGAVSVFSGAAIAMSLVAGVFGAVAVAL